jgi:hypothetical protein
MGNEVFDQLQALFSQSLKHTPLEKRAQIQRRMFSGWRATIVYQEVSGVASVDVRITEPGGLRYLSLRQLRSKAEGP